MKSKITNIELLLDQRLLKGPDPAQGLMSKLAHIKDQGYFNQPEFLQMCRWKSPRPRRFYESNPSAEVRRISIEVFATECEKRKVELLTSLKGVGLPVASAILTLTDPQEYGVIDIRVWQLLHEYGAVINKPKGMNFSLNDWLEYLRRLRLWGQEFKVRARDVERVLFEYHRENQEGTLYGRG